MSRIMIAGTGSGCGKTTITCAILSALKSLGKNIISFKCGPDYIDPMFHKEITKIESRNLDIFLMGEENVRFSLHHNTKNRDLAIIEGVMGLYDGMGSESYASSNNLSILTETEVLLVVNAKGKSNSICAQIKGYLEFENNKICGILLNNISERMYPFYKEMIENKLGIKVVGFLPNTPTIYLKSRHLGLVTANEIHDIQEKLSQLGELAKKFIELDWIIHRASIAPPIKSTKNILKKQSIFCGSQNQTVNIYISRDEAFCFYYEDNHDLLKALGVNIHFFSPLRDKNLPDDAHGLILWGGYPELYAKTLEENKDMQNSIREKIENGLPVYAECGGFIYLHEQLKINEKIYNFIGIFDGKIEMTDKLQNFGYIELTANIDNIFCKKADTINAHSFHHSISDNDGNCFCAKKKSKNITYPCIINKKNVIGGYPHIHFWSNPTFAKNFIQQCLKYKEEVLNGLYNQSRRN